MLTQLTGPKDPTQRSSNTDQMSFHGSSSFLNVTYETCPVCRTAYSDVDLHELVQKRSSSRTCECRNSCPACSCGRSAKGTAGFYRHQGSRSLDELFCPKAGFTFRSALLVSLRNGCIPLPSRRALEPSTRFCKSRLRAFEKRMKPM